MYSLNDTYFLFHYKKYLFQGKQCSLPIVNNFYLVIWALKFNSWNFQILYAEIFGATLDKIHVDTTFFNIV